MFRKRVLWLFLLLALTGTVTAGAKGTTAEARTAKVRKAKASTAKEPAAKELSGMSIVGNDEAPKALYIVPWKSSDVGAETSLSMTLTERAAPVDRDVFMRQLDFYEVSTKK
jgi:hypothetical protein